MCFAFNFFGNIVLELLQQIWNQHKLYVFDIHKEHFKTISKLPLTVKIHSFANTVYSISSSGWFFFNFPKSVKF